MKGVALPLAVTLAVQSLTSMAMIAPTVMAPVVALEIGVPPERLGWFVALEYFLAMLSGLLCGGLIEKFGAMRVCQIAVCLAAAGLAVATGSMLPAMFAAASLIGAAHGLVNPVSSHILIKATPPGMRSLIFSIKQTGVPLGGALAGILVPPLILALGWRWSSVAMTLPCLLVAIAIQPLRAAESAGGTAGTVAGRSRFWAPVALVFSNAAVLELAITSLIYGGVQITLIAYLVSYLKLELGYTLVASGLIYACAHAAGISGRIIWGAVTDRWLSPRVMLGMLGVTMGLSSAAAGCFNPDWPLATMIVVSILFGASAVGWNGVFLAEVARLAPPGQTGNLTGGSQFFTFLGAWVAPPLFGLLVGVSGGYGKGYLWFAAPPLLAGIYLLVWSRRA